MRSLKFSPNLESPVSGPCVGVFWLRKIRKEWAVQHVKDFEIMRVAIVRSSTMTPSLGLWGNCQSFSL